MGNTTLILNFLKVLKWPFVVIIVIFLFRKQIADLILSVKKLNIKNKEIEIEFYEGVNKIDNEVKASLPEKTLKDESVNFTLDRFIELARVSAEACVTQAWKEIEIAAIECLKRKGIIVTLPIVLSTTVLGNALREAGVINGDLLHLFIEMKNLRNNAVHAAQPFLQESTAIRYAKNAILLTIFFRNA